MESTSPSPRLIAACGLYCGTCRSFRKGSCPGCAANDKAAWCKVRTCCREHNRNSCAECTLRPLAECVKFNSFISKVFKLLFRSDRAGCIARIREVGPEAFAREMHLAQSYNRPLKQ